jgi:gas vesicle protein
LAADIAAGGRQPQGKELRTMSDNGGVFVVGFVIGVVTGAAAALLIAPSSGEELRQQLGDKAIELKGTAQQTLEETKSQLDQVSEQGRTRLGENLKKAQQAVQEAQSKLGKTASDADAGPAIELQV